MKNLWIFLMVIALSAFSCSKPDLAMEDGLYSKSDGLYGLTSNGYNGGGGEGDQYTDFGENPFINASEKPVSTFGIDADGASYANMRGYESDGYRIPPEAVRVEEFINYFNFDYPDPSSEHVSINSETAVCPWNTKHFLLRIGLKGKELNGDRPPANFVFLIDVSGSMSGEDKIGVLKSGFKRLAEQLTENDRVAIITYSGTVGVALESVSGSETDQIKKAIDKLTAGGSTAGGAAMEMAYEIAEDNFIEGGNNRIVLGTDGDFNVGVSSTEALIEMVQDFRKLGIYLTICGVGHGNLNESMMEQVANNGDGTYEYIDNGEQIYKVFVQEYDKFFAVAKDAKIKITFDPNFVDSYRLIGYENRALENTEFENDEVDAGEIGASQTITALYQVIPIARASGSFGDLEFRYKIPGQDQSRLLAHSLNNSREEFAFSSDNMRFAASLAGFGMLLKNSEYGGDVSYDQVKEWASNAKSYDPFGFREEYIQLIDRVKRME